MEAGKRVVGVKQSRKAIREGRARRAYLADDADPAIIEALAAETCWRRPSWAGRAASPWAPPWPWTSSRERRPRYFWFFRNSPPAFCKK